MRHGSMMAACVQSHVDNQRAQTVFDVIQHFGEGRYVIDSSRFHMHIHDDLIPAAFRPILSSTKALGSHLLGDGMALETRTRLMLMAA